MVHVLFEDCPIDAVSNATPGFDRLLTSYYQPGKVAFEAGLDEVRIYF